MEWGGFFSPHLPRTYIDEQLDSESANPGDAVINHFSYNVFLHISFHVLWSFYIN